MADYVYIDNCTQKGKIAISKDVFASLVGTALKNVPGIARPEKILKKKSEFRLSQPINIKIHHGIVHASICVDLVKNANLQEITRRIQDEINNILLLTTEQVPFDVQVKVNSLI